VREGASEYPQVLLSGHFSHALENRAATFPQKWRSFNSAHSGSKKKENRCLKPTLPNSNAKQIVAPSVEHP